MIAMYILILNPNSGHGKALEMLPEIEKILHQQGIEYRIEKDHATEDTVAVVRRAAQEQPEGIIAMGGDGTLFQVANGMSGSNVPLIFVSCGTGNDFVRCLNLPQEPAEALKLQLASPVRRIDMGKMNDICFLNVGGTGFDVEVLRLADAYKDKYSGLKPYLFALLEAIKHYKPTTAMVSLDGEPEQKMSFAILSIGNGRYFGGGMKAVPDAKLDDGLFDVVVVAPVKKFMIPLLLVFYIAGKHVRMKLGKLRRCKRLAIRCEGMTVNLDGELIQTDRAEFELLPSALCVRIPKL